MLRILFLCLILSVPAWAEDAATPTSEQKQTGVFKAAEVPEPGEAAEESAKKKLEAAPTVPQLTFEQQVDMVVAIKKDPRILDVKITQDDKNVGVDLVVDKNQDQAQCKQLALNVVMIIKNKSLDDRSKDKDKPGKGLYDYQLNFTRPDGIGLLTAKKPAKEEKLSFENPILIEPATRAGEAGR